MSPLPDPDWIDRVGAGSALAGGFVVAWRVMSGSYRAAMADASRMEKRYEGRLTELDEEVSKLRERSDRCEERERATSLHVARLEAAIVANGGVIPPRLPAE